MKAIKKPISMLLTFVMVLSFFTSTFIVSTSAATHLPCVKQNDAIWKNYYYNEGNLYDTGCGIFSLVNSVGYLTGKRMSVTEVASWAYSINAFNVTDSEGTYRTVLYPNVEKKYGEAYGFTVDCGTGTGYWEGSSSNTLKKHLENGGVAVGHVPGHFIAVVGYDRSENKFHVYDSYATNGRGTKINDGDVWVTQSQFASGQLCLDWFCLLSLADDNDNSDESIDFSASYFTGVYATTAYLNMHSGATASGEILTTIPFNTLIKVTKISGVWGYTSYNNKSGYIRLPYAMRVGDLQSSDPSYTVGVYQTTGMLNMRDAPSTSGNILTTLPSGTTVSVTNIIGGWGYISYNNMNGYISLSYAKRIGDLPPTYPIGVYETTSNLNMRSIASADGALMTTIPKGTAIFVTSVSNTCWGYTSYSGYDGYVNLNYATRTGDLPASADCTIGNYTVKTDINMRSASAYDSSVVTVIPANTIFSITKVSSGWGYTKYKGCAGWINLAYATYVGSLSDTANSIASVGINSVFAEKSTHNSESVESIKITKLPTGKFVAGTEYDLNYCLHGMEIEVTYTDGISEVFTCERYDGFSSVFEFSANCIEYDLFLIPELGENEITVSYGGKTAEFTIVGLTVENIEIIKYPEKGRYEIGQEYDIRHHLDGMEIKVSYSDDTQRTYTYENDTEIFAYELEFSGECFSNSTDWMALSAGENRIVVKHSGKQANLILWSLGVERIEIAAIPDNTELLFKKEYALFDGFYGLKVKVTYADKTSKVYTCGFEDEVNRLFFERELIFSAECLNEKILTPALGTNLIYVHYDDASASFAVNGIILLGDVNSDGEVTVADATLIQRKLVKFSLTDFNENVADANEDGMLTVTDATYIQKWLAGMPSNDKIGKTFK